MADTTETVEEKTEETQAQQDGAAQTDAKTQASLSILNESASAKRRYIWISLSELRNSLSRISLPA